ncbi:MAG TPA: CHAP domain-containing protein [Candidatus Saccharimonadia bacterium]|jgi:surface antigen|nr:CHAP domain-containing protein [Candidatus Saccharimonadia bacterium]
MKNHGPELSSYLKKPVKQRSLERWRTDIRTALAEEPELMGRTLVALIIWCGVLAALHGPVHTSTATASPSPTASAEAAPALAATTGNPQTLNQAALATAARATRLADGPTGQLLPPGSMAPDRTYPNSYAWGQCTWYVAGRRQIPSNWGNATNWYSHAKSAGWSVGTTPAVAAIAWVQSYGYMASADGHVALVEQVSADGTQVYLSEMNFRGVGIKSYRWAPADKFKYIY